MSDQVREELQAKLDEFQIEAKIMDCDPELADTAQFCEHYGFELDDSANTILVASKTQPKQFVACMVLATDRLDVNSKVRKKMEVRKVSFASAEETKELTGMEIGGVTPIGLDTSLKLWIDERVLAREKVVVGGGSRSHKVILAASELLKLPAAIVADITKAT